MSDDIFEFIADKEAFYTGLHLYVSTSQEVIETSQMHMKSETCWPIFSLALNNFFEKNGGGTPAPSMSGGANFELDDDACIGHNEGMREKMKSFGDGRLAF